MHTIDIIYNFLFISTTQFRLTDPQGFSYRFNSTKTSHWIKRMLIKVYGEIDFEKNPLDRNKVDYISRILFPILYFISISIYILVFLIPWVTSKYYYDSDPYATEL